MKHTAKRVGDQYLIYAGSEPIAILNSLDDFLVAAKLIGSLDPAEDGPEVNIICREIEFLKD